LEKGNEINKDEFFWSVAQIYGRLGEFEAGRKDLESLQAIAPDDSLFTGELLLIRALFADGTGKQDQAFDYIDQALQILPRNNEDFGDIAEFVAILLFRPKNVSQPKFDSLKQILLKSSAEIEDITEFFETIGDFYRETSQPQKAFQAYQKAVSKNFDKHQIWEKIIEIEIKKEPLK
jgi:tetratricopeptide (TPR) repeat protein